MRQQPALAAQFAAFEQWHRAQRYNMQTSWGENAGTYSVSSNSSHGDLEKFAQALSVQGHAVRLTESGDELTLSVHNAGSSAPAAPVAEPDETDREYYAAEMQWLADPGQDSTDREFETAERSWLA